MGTYIDASSSVIPGELVIGSGCVLGRFGEVCALGTLEFDPSAIMWRDGDEGRMVGKKLPRCVGSSAMRPPSVVCVDEMDAVSLTMM